MLNGRGERLCIAAATWSSNDGFIDFHFRRVDLSSELRHQRSYPRERQGEHEREQVAAGAAGPGNDGQCAWA